MKAAEQLSSCSLSIPKSGREGNAMKVLKYTSGVKVRFRATVFRDQNDDARTVMAMTWHPDKCKKLAVAYGSCVFQKLSPCKHSYVWDIGKSLQHGVGYSCGTGRLNC